MKLSVILSLLFAVLIAVFALMNGAPVSVNLGFASFVTSQAVVILVSTAIGAVIIYLFDLIAKVKTRFRIKELEKRIATLEKELLDKNMLLQQRQEVAEQSQEPVKVEQVEAQTNNQ